MSFNRKIYPPYWRQFSLYIRKERAGDLCERCGVKNGTFKGFLDMKELERLMELNSDKVPPYLWTGYINGGYLFSETGDFAKNEWLITKKSKIVLTVAHLDNWGGICQCKKFFGLKCAKPSHVQALCQSCHLGLDRPKHLAVQAKNRVAKKDAQRGLLIFV